MDKFLIELKTQKRQVENISDKIEAGQPYMDELKKYLPCLNQLVALIFEMIQNVELELNQDFVLQVLNDIIYGIEQEDVVFLEDVLRYGLIAIFDYIESEFKGEDCNE